MHLYFFVCSAFRLARLQTLHFKTGFASTKVVLHHRVFARNAFMPQALEMAKHHTRKMDPVLCSPEGSDIRL